MKVKAIPVLCVQTDLASLLEALVIAQLVPNAKGDFLDDMNKKKRMGNCKGNVITEIAELIDDERGS